MKKILALAFLLFLASCQTKTGTGALTGGALGAGTGAVIGGGKGALIGGAVGAIGGGVIGSALDEQDRNIMERISPRTIDRMDRGEPLTVSDVIKLSQGGIADETIIHYMEGTKTVYNLTQPQINRMQESGVSRRVINYMIMTGNK